jgi:glutathione S-transferase
MSAGLEADVDRIDEIWIDCRRQFGEAQDGPWLFGEYSIADAMYAPVALRFRTYDVELAPAAARYAQALLALPAMREWIDAAEREAEAIPALDIYE